MPTYEYVCDACSHQFEKFHSITASALRKCPQCGQNKLRRLLGTGAGIIFKGSGFYQTDYRSDSYRKAASVDSSGSSGQGKKDAAGAGSSGQVAKGSAGEKTAE